MKNPQERPDKTDEYRRRLDEFYEQNHEMVSAEDYQKAKADAEYFKALVKRLTDLYQDMGRELVMKDNNYHVWQKRFRRQKNS